LKHQDIAEQEEGYVEIMEFIFHKLCLVGLFKEDTAKILIEVGDANGEKTLTTR